jgi:hypothetical protein
MKITQKSTMAVAILFLLFLCTNRTWSQSETDNNSGKHEIKINGLYILLEYIEISYDYVLGEQSTVGISLSVSAGGDIGYDYMINPNYKLFFNEKKASGFFIEANSALYSGTYGDWIFGGDNNAFGFGLGIAIGGKFMNKQGFIGELILGGGRNFANTDVIGDGYPRFGISIGKRF